MDREEIEKEAYRRYPIEDNNFELLQKSDIMWDGFCEGAEWMQEQKNIVSTHTDNSEVIANMQAEIRHLEALVETQKTIIDYNENQLSVLTEQLDAIHVFCEGVKEHYIKKACKWVKDNINNYFMLDNQGDLFVENERAAKDIEKAMKGE